MPHSFHDTTRLAPATRMASSVFFVVIALGTVSGCKGISPGLSDQDAATMSSSGVDPKRLKECLGMLQSADLAIVNDNLMPLCGSEKANPGERCMLEIEAIRPTQAAIGYEQVELRRLKIRRYIERGTLGPYLQERPEPIVIGPSNRLYIIDHHHLGTALLREGVKRTYAIVVEDLSHLQVDDFWKVMTECQWVYPKDADGKTIDFKDLPAGLEGLGDNPYRSLAGFVRKSDGFAKVPEPFVEFKWAEFFQENLGLSKEEIQRDYEGAVRAAFALARSEKAQNAQLPGYTESKKEAYEMNKATESKQEELARCDAARQAASLRRRGP